GFLSSTDIILVADHGHHEVTNLNAVLCIDQEVKGVAGVDYNVSDTSIFTQSEAHTDEIIANLKLVIHKIMLNIKVYNKSV
ncbi:hypothetical protein PFISCL1PPCAC_17440, partial [Pristionchus fissidentatus]